MQGGKAALRQLLRQGDDVYTVSPGSLTTYDAGVVSLPRGQEAPVPLEDVLEGDALRYYLEFETRLLLGDEEYAKVCEDTDSPGCYMDPILSADARKYAAFVVGLFRCKMVHFVQRPRGEAVPSLQRRRTARFA